VIHVNRADKNGSGQILGADPYFDDVFLGAADRRFVTAERIIDTDQFASEGPLQSLCISRLLTHGVVETTGGAHFTACVPDYSRDEEFQRSYATAAGDADQWAAFSRQYLKVPEAEYQAAVGGAGAAGAGAAGAGAGKGAS
jgi:glutaconate CoA-transferase subunit A